MKHFPVVSAALLAQGASAARVSRSEFDELRQQADELTTWMRSVCVDFVTADDGSCKLKPNEPPAPTPAPTPPVDTPPPTPKPVLTVASECSYEAPSTGGTHDAVMEFNGRTTRYIEHGPGRYQTQWDNTHEIKAYVKPLATDGFICYDNNIGNAACNGGCDNLVYRSKSEEGVLTLEECKDAVRQQRASGVDVKSFAWTSDPTGCYVMNTYKKDEIINPPSPPQPEWAGGGYPSGFKGDNTRNYCEFQPEGTDNTRGTIFDYGSQAEHVRLKYELDGGIQYLVHEVKGSDGTLTQRLEMSPDEWHFIRATRTGSEITLQVDTAKDVVEGSVTQTQEAMQQDCTKGCGTDSHVQSCITLGAQQTSGAWNRATQAENYFAGLITEFSSTFGDQHMDRALAFSSDNSNGCSTGPSKSGGGYWVDQFMLPERPSGLPGCGPTDPASDPTASPAPDSAESRPPLPVPSISQDNRCHSCHFDCGFEKAYDGEKDKCGRCSLYGSPSSPGPVSITYSYGAQVQASKWPVVVDYGGNGYYGSAQVVVAVDGVQVASQSIAQKPSYAMDPYQLTINHDFETIKFTLSGGTSGTGPNPSMSVCEIGYAHDVEIDDPTAFPTPFPTPDPNRQCGVGEICKGPRYGENGPCHCAGSCSYSCASGCGNYKCY